MNQISLFCIIVSIFSFICYTNGQTGPEITAWKKSTGNGTGYGVGMTNNVYKIQYSTKFVYTYSNSIPSYSIGPWYKNPGIAAAKGFVFQFPRTPSVATTKQKKPPGHFGLWIDGVAIYGPGDAISYNSLGVWNRNAIFWEKSAFDTCNGHPDRSSEYHLHQNPICLYNYKDSTVHAPLIGFAFDGYPIYGPYGYSSATDSASSIKLMTSSYRIRSISSRTSLSNGTVLSSTYYGPTIDSTSPIGSYLEDFEYVSGSGDLDAYNGRNCITPDYPSGTYAYFVTMDSSYAPTYPYIVGPYYYGNPNMANIGPGSGKVTITEAVATYF